MQEPKFAFGETPIFANLTFDYATAQKPLNIEWAGEPTKLYTVIFYDVTLPNAIISFEPPYVHFLEINVPGNRLEAGDILASYVSPTPPTGTHLYSLEIYRQTGRISFPFTKRSRFNIPSVTTDFGSKLETRVMFSVESGNSPVDPPVKESWIKEGSPLSEREQAFCRCSLEVAGKQPAACNTERAWGETRQGKTCYNPYAVCASRVGTTSRKCGEWYDFNVIPDEQLRGYATLNRIHIPLPYDRKLMLDAIYSWKESKV